MANVFLLRHLGAFFQCFDNGFDPDTFSNLCPCFVLFYLLFGHNNPDLSIHEHHGHYNYIQAGIQFIVLLMFCLLQKLLKYEFVNNIEKNIHFVYI